ncbi:MAG: LysR family transcriptional regulator [Burkholderiaceae bacterium]|nr:MAG: LysR family transcriptional regulator [Burkholderiaceae bacterium]
MASFNYRHLHYFWVVAHEGAYSRAAERLDVSLQTISAQVHALEADLGHQLLMPKGRGIALTRAGEAALLLADTIFSVGETLPTVVHDAASRPRARLAVGLCDGLSKLAAHDWLSPVLQTPDLHLLCHEGELEQLLGELQLRQLDVVLAGQPAGARPGPRLVSRRVSQRDIAWWAPQAWAGQVLAKGFPQGLAEVPLLLPTTHSPLRPLISAWLQDQVGSVTLAGEFEDSALMAVFAARGMGAFPCSEAAEPDLRLMPGLVRLGPCEVQERVYAITRPGPAGSALLSQLMDEPVA